MSVHRQVPMLTLWGLTPYEHEGHFHDTPGLERFEGVEAYNMSSQIPNEELIAKAKELNADAILVSADCNTEGYSYRKPDQHG